MPNLTIGRSVALIFGALISGILLLGGATWQSFEAERTALEWSAHTRNVLAAVQETSLAILAAETGQRGYLLTGRDEYLLPSDEAIQRLGGLRADLRDLTADDAGHRNRMAALGPVLDSKLAELASTVDLRRGVGLGAALGTVLTDAGRDDMVRIAALLTGMRSAEQRLLGERLVDAERLTYWVRILVGAGVLLAILTLLWAARLLYRAATVDALTGLRSRNRMWEVFTAWDSGPRPPMAAMLMLDIDRFRSVNQVFGPVLGDEVIAEVGRRLASISGRHSVGRLGGDDFAICCVGITIPEAEQLGLAAVAILARPFDIRQQALHLTASVGIAHSDTAGTIDLRQGADDARYVAKTRGGNQLIAFLPSMHEFRREQAKLEQGLHLALEGEGELTVAYQPVVRMSDRKLIAVEALARWNHPQLGPIPPDRFIELAEARGLIVPLGLKLMTIAVAQAADWYRRFPRNRPIVNINISPVQLASSDVIDDLVDLIERHGLPLSGFCIEVTESAFTDARAVEALRKARRLGFKVTMDDFGIGYSSLSQLPRLPLVSIKLDRSFISHASESAGDAAILRAIASLAHELGLTVIAEGVEDS
ncbi:MAG: Diguanylate cyclase protein, partial [Rubritepida sp.]|nr:Diguanylate cyclase protein [Rubritepida sp.]